MNYDHANIEAKWQKYWQEHDTFHTTESEHLEM